MKKISILTLSLIVSFFIISCSDDTESNVENEPLNANFNFELSSETIPSELTITNNSTGAESYQWTFEGGSPESSTDESPGTILYENTGDFTISLTISSGVESDTHTESFSLVLSETTGWSLFLEKNDIPFSNRYGMVSFVIGNIAYMGGGTTTASSSGAVESFYALNLDTNEFTEIAAFPGGPINWGVGFSINNMGYVGSGNINGDRSNLFYKYNPSLNEWAQTTDFPGTERNWTTLVVHEGKAYFGLGAYGGSTSLLNDFWVYDPETEQWDELASFPGGIRHSAIGFSIGSLIYVGGGTNADRDHLDDFWSYDPNNNSWQAIANLPGVLSESSSASIGNYGIIIGGVTNEQNQDASDNFGITTTAVSIVLRYDPINNIWEELIKFPYMPRTRALCFVSDEKIYYGSSGFLSVSNGWINDNEIYVFNP